MEIPKYVYHYTSEEGLQGILRDRRIKTSEKTTRDAKYGIGVYFSDEGPGKLNDADQLRVMYGRAYSSRKNRIQVCTCFESEKLPGLVKKDEEKRTVYVVPADVDIDRSEAKIMKRNPATGSWTGDWE